MTSNSFVCHIVAGEGGHPVLTSPSQSFMKTCWVYFLNNRNVTLLFICTAPSSPHPSFLPSLTSQTPWLHSRISVDLYWHRLRACRKTWHGISYAPQHAHLHLEKTWRCSVSVLLPKQHWHSSFPLVLLTSTFLGTLQQSDHYTSQNWSCHSDA